MADDASGLESGESALQSTEIHSHRQYILQDELITRAQKDFSSAIQEGLFSPDDVQKFVSEKVLGVRVNGIDVISIDFEHSDEAINPIFEAYIRSPKTRVLVAEYFYPELKSNMERTGLLTYIKRLGRDFANRIEYAEKISNLCSKTSKPVAVADISNKAKYMFFREFLRHLPNMSTIIWASVGADPEVIRVLEMANVTWLIGLLYQMALNKGIYDTEKVSKLDKFILDFEQARRLYAARGIEQLTEEYSPSSQSERDESQIVVMYPKAHGVRIADYLINPNRNLDKIKGLFYKLLGQGLDFSVRQWRRKDSLQKLADSGYRWGEQGSQISKQSDLESADLANWILFSERKISA